MEGGVRSGDRMIDIELSLRGLEEVMSRLSAVPGAIEKAQRLAIGRVLESLRTEAKRGVTGEYHAKGGDVLRSITLRKRANGGELISRGKRKSLAEYKLTAKKPGKRKKVLLGAVRRTGLKVLDRAFLLRPHEGGKYYPYVRVGPGRRDIKALISPAISQLVGSQRVSPEMLQRAQEVFVERVRYESMRMIGALR